MRRIERAFAASTKRIAVFRRLLRVAAQFQWRRRTHPLGVDRPRANAANRKTLRTQRGLLRRPRCLDCAIRGAATTRTHFCRRHQDGWRRRIQQWQLTGGLNVRHRRQPPWSRSRRQARSGTRRLRGNRASVGLGGGAFSSVAANVTSLLLVPGEWDVQGKACGVPAVGVSQSLEELALHPTVPLFLVKQCLSTKRIGEISETQGVGRIERIVALRGTGIL